MRIDEMESQLYSRLEPSERVKVNSWFKSDEDGKLYATGRIPEELWRKLEVAEDTNVSIDMVDHPSHYTAYKGLEIIDLTEQMSFNRGNVVKYVARAGLKDPATEIEDLRKARWYLDREIERLNRD